MAITLTEKELDFLKTEVLKKYFSSTLDIEELEGEEFLPLNLEEKMDLFRKTKVKTTLNKYDALLGFINQSLDVDYKGSFGQSILRSIYFYSRQENYREHTLDALYKFITDNKYTRREYRSLSKRSRGRYFIPTIYEFLKFKVKLIILSLVFISSIFFFFYEMPNLSRSTNDVHEVKWKIDTLLADKLSQSFINKLVPKVAGYQLENEEPSVIKEIQVYHDTDKFTFFKDGNNLIYKIYFSGKSKNFSAKKCRWLFTSKNSSLGDPNIGWSRVEFGGEEINMSSDEITNLANLSISLNKYSMSNVFENHLRQLGITTTTLEPKVVLILSRNQWRFNDPESNNYLNVQVSYIYHAFAYKDLIEQDIPLNKTWINNGFLSWRELEIEEHLKDGTIVPRYNLKKRLSSFISVFGLDNLKNDSLPMAKYHHALKELDLY